jgi:hypothetical protein
LCAQLETVQCRYNERLCADGSKDAQASSDEQSEAESAAEEMGEESGGGFG